MTEMTTEQLIYLLYSNAYADTGTVTRSEIKASLPSEWKQKAEEIYAVLKEGGLIELRTKDGKPTEKEGRFSVTENGKKVLVENLATTDYQFKAAKGPKVLNLLLDCIKRSVASQHQNKSLTEMSPDEFSEKLKKFYYEKRKQKGREGGVVIVYRHEMAERFEEEFGMPKQEFDKYFDKAKRNRSEFSTVVNRDGKDETMEWVE